MYSIKSTYRSREAYVCDINKAGSNIQSDTVTLFDTQLELIFYFNVNFPEFLLCGYQIIVLSVL